MNPSFPSALVTPSRMVARLSLVVLMRKPSRASCTTCPFAARLTGRLSLRRSSSARMSSSLTTPALLLTPVSLLYFKATRCDAHVFSGTSLIALPTDMAEMINSQIGAKRGWNGQYTVECSDVPNLPDLTLYFDATPYVLKGTDYILEAQGTCISAFTGLDMPNGLNLWIVGMYPRVILLIKN